MRLNVPTPYLPYADGEFLTPSGQVRVRTRRGWRSMGFDPLPDVHAAVRVPGGGAGARGALSR